MIEAIEILGQFLLIGLGLVFGAQVIAGLIYLYFMTRKP